MKSKNTSILLSLVVKIVNAFFNFVLNVTHFVKCKIYEIQHIVHSFINPKYELSRIIMAKEELKNLPHHISFAFEAEKGEIELADLVKIITWCELLEIPFISFYDDFGVVASLEDKLAQSFQGFNTNNNNNNTTKSMTAREIIASRNGNVASKRKGYLQHGSSKVMFLDYNDGKKAIVSSLVELCSRPTNGKGNQIDMDSVAKNLKEKYRFPEPDLVVKFGPTFSMFGYPPLALRISEIFTQCSHKKFTVFQFLNTLKLYQQRDRRCGK